MLIMVVGFQLLRSAPFFFSEGAVWLELYGFAGAGGMVDFAKAEKIYFQAAAFLNFGN